MRRPAVLLASLSLLLASACTPPWSRTVVNPPSQGRYISETPTAAQLVGQLNATSQRLQSLECRDVWIEAKQGQQPVSLPGSMVCQRTDRSNRNFRLTAK